MPWLDIVLIAVVIIFALVGFFKGFWRSFVSLFSSIIVIVLSILLSKPIGNLLESWFGLSTNIAGSLQAGFEDYFSNNDWHSGWMYALLLALVGKSYLDTEPSASDLASVFSSSVGKIIVSLICIVVVFVIIKILLWLILKLTKKLSFRRSHRIFDRIFGVVVGVFKGFFGIATISWAIYALCGAITPLGEWFSSVLSNCPVANWMYGLSVKILESWILPFLLR